MLIHDVAVVASSQQVGLFANEGAVRELRVPVGMEHLPASLALAILYKTFVVFRRSRRSRNRLGAHDGVEAAPRDGLDNGTGGFAFCDALALDELFDRVDPTRLLSLVERRARRAGAAHDRIDRQLQHALFDAEGVPYLERAYGRRHELRYGTGDIVGLYCFLAEDFYRGFLRVDLDTAWGRFAAEGTAMAAEFRHRYLTNDATLHGDDAHDGEETLARLRLALLTIDRNTPFRSSEYRTLHDALDRYLNGGTGQASCDGLVWGVADFWAVWESVCLVHAFAAHANVLTCDADHLPAGIADARSEKEWLRQRETIFARNEIARRPDLVTVSDEGYRIIDFKFRATPAARRVKSGDGAVPKHERDFLNIEAYGLLLQNHLLRERSDHASAVALEMWFPGDGERSAPCGAGPRWDPPLSVRTLPTGRLVDAYSRLYDGLRTGPT